MITAVFAAAWILPAGLMLLDGRRRVVAWLAVAGFAALALLLGLTLRDVVQSGPLEQVAGGWPAGVGIRLRADALGAVFAFLTSLVVLAAVWHQAARGIASRSFPALAGFLQLGLTGVFLTADAFNFYVFFEVAMTASFALAAYGGTARQYRAAYTFAVVNLLGSALFLAAVAGLYHVTGTLDMIVIATRIEQASPTAVLTIAVATFVAFGLKLGLFPFHFWLPPVYRDTAPTVAAMLSGALANIGTYGLLRFGGGILWPAIEGQRELFLVLGSASVLYGGLLAASRPVYAEVLAYSSIAQAGYILLAIGLGGPAGFAAAVIYGIVNSLTKALLLLTGEVRAPLLAGAALVGALSVTGVPPSAGFFVKVALVRAGVQHGQWLVVAVVALGGALSILYMFNAHILRFWTAEDAPAGWRPAALWLLPAALAGVVLGLGLWPEPLLWLGEQAAAALARPEAPMSATR